MTSSARASSDGGIVRLRVFAVLTGDLFIYQKRELIADLILQKRLVAVTPYRDLTKLGALMSYGVDYADIYHKAANYVDKIFKGADPADLSFEQPTKFDFVINALSHN